MADGFDIVSYLMGKQAGGEPPGPTPGGYGYTKLAEQDFTVNTSSTSEITVGYVEGCAAAYDNKNKLCYVRIRGKAGKRNGYAYGTDTFLLADTRLIYAYKGYNNNIKISAGVLAVYPHPQISSDGKLQICAKHSNTFSIDDEFHVEVYLLDWPDGVSPFN